MSTPHFDERYPAMFQPGGEGTDTPVLPAAGMPLAASAAATVSPPNLDPADLPAPESVPESEPGLGKVQVPHANAEPETSWRPLLWITALASSAVLLAAGLSALTVQFWLPSAQTIDPADFQGIDLRPWGQSVFVAAPSLIAAGFAIPAVLLLLLSRHDPVRESARRTVFLVLTVVLGIAGWMVLFATELFPGVAATWQYAYNRQPTLPWTYAVGGTGVWLFSLSLLMLAALLVVPRRWPRPAPDVRVEEVAGQTDDGVTDLPAPPANTPPVNAPITSTPTMPAANVSPANTPQTSRLIPAVRGLIVGAVVIAGAMFALFAPYLYPASTGIIVVELAGGHQTSIQDWAGVSYKLVTPLMAVGTVLIAAALLTLATAPGTGLTVGRAPKAPNDVEL